MVYIQSNKERTLPHHFDCACAMYGAMDSALDFRLTSFEEVSSGKLDHMIKSHLFVGSVEFMREVFKRIGIKDVRLPMNSDRPHELITLKEAQERVANGENIFIKPIEIKLFTGLVLDGMQYSSLKGLPDDTKIMAYKPFKEKILSEWRVYINNGKIIDSRNYSGDVTINLNYGWVNHKLSQLKDKNFPIAYTMDVAVFDSLPSVSPIYEGQAIVEFNDMWAIGNYGMPNDLYLKLLKERYFEIIKT